MKRIFKVMIPLLIFAILFSSCALNNSDKTLEQISIYINENKFNECYQLVKELDSDTINEISSDACNIIIAKFIELKDNAKIKESNIFDLSLIDTAFAEKCKKLWNTISLFKINKEYEQYGECLKLRFYSEMINYTQYCDIYSLAKKVNNSGYLERLSEALEQYESNGENSSLKLLYDEINAIDLSSFDPQQYLVSDYKNANNEIINSLSELNEGFSSGDSTAVAGAINELYDALSEILYIADTLIAVNSMQNAIYNKISKENLFAPFENDITIKKRDFVPGISFSLDLIFGGIEADKDEDSTVATTTPFDEKTPIKDVIKIATSAINKTKAFTSNVEVTLTQERNIRLSGFEADQSLADSENMLRHQLSQVVEKSNGKGRRVLTFANGTSTEGSLSSFVPPANNQASLESDCVIDYTCVKGSGGYIITLKLKPELIKSGNKSSDIGSIINTFEFDNSADVNDFNTSYSETDISLIINNNGMLIEMEYTIDGVSDCDFNVENNNQYEAQFTFNNTYTYEFKY